MLVVGLTGGVASGKSSAADVLSELGAPVLDADAVARDVVAPGTPGLAAVVEAFGDAVLDAQGQLDRAALRKQVFADPARRKTLEGIIHPAVRAAMSDWLRQQDAPYAVLMIPLLVEGGLQSITDVVIAVDVDPDTQVQRLMQRDGIDERLARQMLAAQASRQARLDVADIVVDNSGSLDALHARMQSVHRQLLNRARPSG